MARPPQARSKILDAYIAILREEGERSATLDATAARAGVSKGGLLYHFASKDLLARAVIEETKSQVERDLQAMRTAEEGCALYYVRTSAEMETDLDRHMVGVQRLAQAGHEEALNAMRWIHRQWLELIVEEVQDPVVAQAIMLIGEGIYTQCATTAPWYDPTAYPDMTQLLGLVRQMKSMARSDGE